MSAKKEKSDKKVMNGVMLNAYPDSIGNNLSDLISMLKYPDFKDAFSFFYVLPTFFNSDLDRGFSVIDYNLNKELVSADDLKALEEMGIALKCDIVLNHLSVASPQFKDLLKYGNKSEFKDFFINWNTFWEGNGTMGEDGIIHPKQEFLDKLFMRKAGLPILKVFFPEGTEEPFWNTFYQQITYQKLTIEDLQNLGEIPQNGKEFICNTVNLTLAENHDVSLLDLEEYNFLKEELILIIKQKRTYLGQMDLNANSPLVWKFYEETLQKLAGYGCKIVRLDAFAYLHKEIGQSNFFNKPGTWDYLDRIKQIAIKNDLILLPEIHAEYGCHLHDEVANRGFQTYDFFFPGLVIHTLETGSNRALVNWAREVVTKEFKTVNMLGCHDGIPVLDLKGKEIEGTFHPGLLSDEEIDFVMNKIIERGGRVKNLYDSKGKKISYYQVNATFFSALGEDEQKLLLARAIQLFMPGIPQVWYLDIFAGSNDYKAADRGGNAGHKEINRTNITLRDVEDGLKSRIVKNQLKLIQLRNQSKAFLGAVSFGDSAVDEIDITWEYENEVVQLTADLKTYHFNVNYYNNRVKKTMSF
ncbi:glycosidase [Namhaeicola litoreus]|uniref:Glycosidase n=1 Tax=Namhaeicola litoreus TaxID=1052145 RepID=A0ABW3Y288_9FLAO